MTIPHGLGVGIPTQTVRNGPAAAAKLRAAWWHDWGCSHVGAKGYVPMMYRETIWPVRTAIGRSPGSFWLGPNEPELGSQANMTPEDCVKEMQKVQKLGARMAWPAILLTPFSTWSLQWFKRFSDVWAGPRPEVLTVHIYGVRTGTQWNELFEDWYRFLRTLGLGDLQTVVTESNSDHGDEEDQIGMMRYLAWRLGQDDRMRAVAWFAANWYRHEAVNLIDVDGRLTRLGREFRELVSG